MTVRLLPVVGSLRNGRAFRVVRRCIAAGRERFGFRLIEFSLQGQHLHLVCEADDRRALSRGMQGLNVRLARRLNRHLGRSGTLLAERFHSRVLKTPTEVKNLLAYVLCNARRHARQRGDQLERGWIDPFSSGPHFTGWCELVRPPAAVRARPVLDGPAAILAPPHRVEAPRPDPGRHGPVILTAPAREAAGGGPLAARIRRRRRRVDRAARLELVIPGPLSRDPRGAGIAAIDGTSWSMLTRPAEH